MKKVIVSCFAQVVFKLKKRRFSKFLLGGTGPANWPYFAQPELVNIHVIYSLLPTEHQEKVIKQL